MNNKAIDDWLIFTILGLERSGKKNHKTNTKQNQEPLKEKCREAIKRQFRQETQMSHIHNRFTEWTDLNGAQIRNGFIFIQLLHSVRLCRFSLLSTLCWYLGIPQLFFYFYLCGESHFGDYYSSSDIKSQLLLCQTLISQQIQLRLLFWAHPRSVASSPAQGQVWKGA